MRGTDRRVSYAERRAFDAESYVVMGAQDIVERAIEEIEALELKVSPQLPTKTHVALAEAARKRIIKRLKEVRYL